MTAAASDGTRDWTAEAAVQADLQRQPHLFLQLAENALTSAESLRANYFKNTATFVAHLRAAIRRAERRGGDSLLQIRSVADVSWPEVAGEVVSFVDGGVGHMQIAGRSPILLRVGSYTVRIGERRLAERERFGYFPVILGDLEGGNRERRDFPDLVRVTAELLGCLSALQRTPDLRVLLLHGPLVYPMGRHIGQTPFTEGDIDRFLQSYAPGPERGASLKERFLTRARLDVYPWMTARAAEWTRRRLFEPLAWIAFLYHELIDEARRRTPRPLIAGVVERSQAREFSHQVLLRRVFRSLAARENEGYFNEMFGRADLTTPQALLDRLGYTDALLMGLLLRPGEYSEPWSVDLYGRLDRAEVALPGEPGPAMVDYSTLRGGEFGFPAVQACYLAVADTVEPVRVEVFEALGEGQIGDAARRAYLYARLLPGYGFPVGLDIADKVAHVPGWLTEAYSKLIRLELGVSLQRGEVTDRDTRAMLVRAIYMQHRDWLYRPTARGREGAHERQR